MNVDMHIGMLIFVILLAMSTLMYFIGLSVGLNKHRECEECKKKDEKIERLTARYNDLHERYLLPIRLETQVEELYEIVDRMERMKYYNICGNIDFTPPEG